LSLISAEGLTKHYGRVEALRKVSFKVEEGVTGLIGPNGAGKSTLIKILMGIVTPNCGDAKIFGLDSRRERGRIMERVGVLHEKPQFPSWVTARQYLEYVAELKRLQNASESIREVCEICGLTGFIDRRIGTFSAGMVQRLGLADALIGKPELVILDEPTANLDPFGRFDIMKKIECLRDEEDMNFLISTHILSELEKVCDSVIILNQGLVLTYGPLSELVSEYTRPKYLVKVDDPPRLVRHFEEHAAAKLQVRGDFVFAEVKDRSEFIGELNRLVKEGVIVLEEMRFLSASLEDIFIEALRRRQA
jgi:ABC-2 type transport system ATP-binding protein